MQQKEQERLQQYQQYISKKREILKDYKTVKPLEEKEWGEFYLKDIFSEIQRGKRLKRDDHIKGDIPYVSSTAMNNGIDGFVGNEEKTRRFENV